MNIFIMPSWYPSPDRPIDGIFIKEQAEAMANIFPEHNFFISHAGNFFFSITEISKYSKTIGNYFNAKPFTKEIKPNLIEFYKPVLTWTEKLGGENKNIINAHFENLSMAESRAGKIDILHAHVSYPAGFAAMKIKERFNVPVVITEHMAPFPFETYIENGKLSYKIMKPLVAAAAIIAVSSFQAERINSFGIKKPVVIPNSVNENLFIPSDTERKNSKVKFLTVNTFIARKGIEELLEGILKSNPESGNSEFIIAGTGYMENYIEEFIKTNNLSRTVTLIKNPARDEVIKLFRECDVFLLPARLESFGIVYIEAMACGKPVIATDCGGPSDFVKDFNGRLIPVRNPEAIAEAINYFVKNISAYSSEKIRNFVLDNFSEKVVCSEIVAVYEDVLKNKQHNPA